MMFLLSSDAAPHRFAVGCADSKGPVALLPCKCGQANFLMYPAGGGAFYFPQHIRKAMSGAESREDMNVILHAPDNFWNSIQ